MHLIVILLSFSCILHHASTPLASYHAIFVLCFRALNAVLAQTRILPRSQAAVYRWMALPLLADMSPQIRKTYVRNALELPSALESKLAAFEIVGDDIELPAVEIAYTSEAAHRIARDVSEYVAAESVTQEINVGILARVTRVGRAAVGASRQRYVSEGKAEELGHREEERRGATFLTPSDWKEKPSISRVLLNRIGKVGTHYCGKLHPKHLDKCEYYLQKYTRNRGVQGAAQLTLAQLIGEVGGEIENVQSKEAQGDNDDGGERKGVSLAPSVSSSATVASWTKAVLKGIVYNASTDVTRELRELVKGCALALRHIAATHDPKLVMKLVTENVLRQAYVYEGDLIVMRECFAAVTEKEDCHTGQESIRSLVPSEVARRLVKKLVAVLKHKQLPLKTKAASLDIIGEITLLSGCVL